MEPGKIQKSGWRKKPLIQAFNSCSGQEIVTKVTKKEKWDFGGWSSYKTGAPVSNTSAFEALETAVKWLEAQPEMDPYHLLRSLYLTQLKLETIFIAFWFRKAVIVMENNWCVLFLCYTRNKASSSFNSAIIEWFPSWASVHSCLETRGSAVIGFSLFDHKDRCRFQIKQQTTPC